MKIFERTLKNGNMYPLLGCPICKTEPVISNKQNRVDIFCPAHKAKVLVYVELDGFDCSDEEKLIDMAVMRWNQKCRDYTFRSRFKRAFINTIGRLK
jgi:hypothetical protein